MLSNLAFHASTLDVLLTQWVAAYGAWAIGLVAAIIFAETGLVFAPFLPGDSLLFLTGTVLAAAALDVHLAVAALATAAVVGDGLNYAVGHWAAPRVMQRLHGRWLRPSHLEMTHAYFARFGAPTIVIARFVPIVRTLAPFLAGAGAMPYRRFAIFNVAGALLWVAGLVYAGAWLGTQPFARQHIGVISLGIVALSLVPVLLAALKARRSSQGAAPPARTDLSNGA